MVAEKSTYEIDPDFTAPYAAGILSQETLRNAADWMNAVRFIAGIPDNVSVNAEYCIYAQASSMVNYLNNSLSHDPAKPEGMADDLYELGRDGASTVNQDVSFSDRQESQLIIMEMSSKLKQPVSVKRRYIRTTDIRGCRTFLVRQPQFTRV